MISKDEGKGEREGGTEGEVPLVRGLGRRVAVRGWALRGICVLAHCRRSRILLSPGASMAAYCLWVVRYWEE